MRMMMIALAAVLAAVPLSAQTGGGGTADAWRRMRAPDARLRVDFADAVEGAAVDAVAARMGLERMLLVGFAAGCVGGVLVMPAVADEMPAPEARFLGCIIGAAAGGFLAGVYGLATRAG